MRIDWNEDSDFASFFKFGELYEGLAQSTVPYWEYVLIVTGTSSCFFSTELCATSIPSRSGTKSYLANFGLSPSIRSVPSSRAAIQGDMWVRRKV